MNEWISINDRLPDKPYKYLVYRPDAKSEMAKVRTEYFCGGKRRELNHGFGPSPFAGLASVKITHWMPLPDPPV